MQGKARRYSSLSQEGTQADRSLQARRAAHLKWAKTDPREGTLAARRALQGRFEQAADPERKAFCRSRSGYDAEHLKKAFYLDLSRRSAEARRRA